MADGQNFTMAPFPPEAIEYSSTEGEPKISCGEIAMPSVLVSAIMILGQIMWLKLSAKWENLREGDLQRNPVKLLEGKTTRDRSSKYNHRLSG
ncbi:uncharacterized protein [Drosophila takahashii]|uniref:uncharacterized protein n=1 Tax=Drosophila takahashii TaxID=29030 RepID=UPI0007E73688|nr:uncharacterized protein LOC108058955 [Drosophila takahashii]